MGKIGIKKVIWSDTLVRAENSTTHYSFRVSKSSACLLLYALELLRKKSVQGSSLEVRSMVLLAFLASLEPPNHTRKLLSLPDI